jgi:drug/metabolite transporter (DMT)-like permease
LLNSELSALFFGLASAASWGAGDFNGGLAAKRNNVYTVVIFSQLVGAIFLVGVAILFAEQIASAEDMLTGAGAGLVGAIGLVALYRGLAGGRMGLVAPVAAVVTAIVPVIFGLLLEGLPPVRQLAGFGLALVAVWIISRPGDGADFRLRDLSTPCVAGLGFGLFFILIDRVSEGAILWPLVAARIASISMIFVVVRLVRQGQLPGRTQLPVIALAGIFDTGGNAFFALATQMGRLDIAAVLSSLYPATTVLLAHFILQERLSFQQWAGVAVALLAIILIAS